MIVPVYLLINSKIIFKSNPMDILYINVIEQNAGWGAETFLNNEFQSLGHIVANLDFRKHRKVLATKLNQVPDFDVLFLQRGDRFPPYLLKTCNRPKFFWASELVSRNRDQDILLKSNLFNHIFVHSDACKSKIIQNKWTTKEKLTVMLNGFNPKLHYKMDQTKDIDVLFVGSILPRREKILNELKIHFNIKICSVFGEEMSKLLNRSKIVLNIHAEEYLDTETRMFEALGCGAFVISEKLGNENPFIPEKHYIEVANLETMKNKIFYYLNNQVERENISINGYEEAMENHTYQARAQEFINQFNRHIDKATLPAFSPNKLTFFSQIEKVANKFR